MVGEDPVSHPDSNTQVIRGDSRELFIYQLRKQIEGVDNGLEDGIISKARSGRNGAPDGLLQFHSPSTPGAGRCAWRTFSIRFSGACFADSALLEPNAAS